MKDVELRFLRRIVGEKSRLPSLTGFGRSTYLRQVRRVFLLDQENGSCDKNMPPGLRAPAWLVFVSQADLSFQLIFGTIVIGMAKKQSAEVLMMRRARARFTNLPPCFL
jgi:hypothetical protein